MSQHFTMPLFSIVVGFIMIFYYVILTLKKKKTDTLIIVKILW